MAKPALKTDSNETFLNAAIGWRQASKKGRGVYALRNIRKGEVIERAPVVPMAKKDIPRHGAVPDGYVLEWKAKKPEEAYALVLGYIMLYNHSGKPNILLENDYQKKTITATAIRAIKEGEELTWDYGCELWFTPK